MVLHCRPEQTCSSIVAPVCFRRFRSSASISLRQREYCGAKTCRTWGAFKRFAQLGSKSLFHWYVWSSVAGSFGICLVSQPLHSWVFKTGRCKTVTQNLWYLRKLVCFFWKVLKVEAYWWWIKKLKWIIGWYFFPLIFFQGYCSLVVCRGHFNELT